MPASFVLSLYRPENHHNTERHINTEIILDIPGQGPCVQDTVVRFSWIVAIKPQSARIFCVSFFWPSLAIAASEALDPPDSSQIIDFLKGLRRFARNDLFVAEIGK
jgi:hypothetical protein